MNKNIYKFMLYYLTVGNLGNSLVAIESSPSTIEKSASVDALENMDSIVSEALEAFNVPGAAIGIVIDGKVVFVKGYG